MVSKRGACYRWHATKERRKKIGLERHVNKVIERADPDLLDQYYWHGGSLFVVTADVAERIMRILDASGEFGPTRYNVGAIEFGEYCDFYPEQAVLCYAEYWDKFKSGSVD